MKHLYILISILLCSWFPAMTQEICMSSVPEELYRSLHNDDFTVLVRQLPDGEWVDLYEYKVEVNLDEPTHASMVNFDFAGEVEVMVRKNNGTAHEAVIRPLSYGVKHKLKDNVLRFKLSRPQNLSIEFDGDRLHNLHLFANAPEQDTPAADDAGVMYFGPGIHTPADGGEYFSIPSNTRMYLAAGAILKGTLLCDSVENVRIGGRGLLLTPNRGVEMKFSRNVTVEDLIVINPQHYTVYAGQCDDVIIRNIRSFSSKLWSDGIDMMSCKNVNVIGVFMRNSDDCIAVYGPRWDFYGDARNIVVENSTLWADVAHNINMGTHGYTGDGVGNVIENITFRNLDILEHDEDVRIYEGCMAISCGDLNLIRDILYEDIRVERIEEGQLFHFDVVQNEEYCTAPGRGVENVTLRNITCCGEENLLKPSIEGYSADRVIRNVVLDNVRIGGKKIKSVEELKVNDFVENISFR